MMAEEIKEAELFSRLSIEINDIKHIHNLVNTLTGGSNVKAGAIVNTYDIISAETKTEKIFE